MILKSLVVILPMSWRYADDDETVISSDVTLTLMIVMPSHIDNIILSGNYVSRDEHGKEGSTTHAEEGPRYTRLPITRE